jgi:hypothetical protein
MDKDVRNHLFTKKATFLEALANGDVTDDNICYILDVKLVYTKGAYFGMSTEDQESLATVVSDVSQLKALTMFAKVSDGTNTMASATNAGTLVFHGGGKTTVTVSSTGVTIDTANATVATGDSNGQVKIDGQNVSVKGLGSAAYTDASAYATSAQGTLASNAVPKTRTVNGHALSSDVTVTKADIGLGNVTNESKATMFASAALTGTPTAPTAAASVNNTQIATTAYVQTAISNNLASSQAMLFKGTLGTGGTITALPSTTAQVGWTYKVITAGTYGGQVCEVGDLIICLTAGSSSTEATWTVSQGNIDGAVTGPSEAVEAHVAVFNGATGKIIKDSGFTIGTSVPSGAKFTDTTYANMKAATASAAGAAGLVPAPSAGSQAKFLRGDGTWQVPTNTTYTFASGSAGSFTVTPSGGSAITVSVGKPDTAGTADKVASTMIIKLNGGTTEGTNMFSFDGSAAKTVNITPSAIGAAASSHNQAANTINKMTGYTMPTTTSAIAATDTLNEAIGKLERANGWVTHS